MNILLIRFSSMGDVIVQTPFLKWLKINFPHIHIHFLTLDSNEALIDEIDLIDTLHLYNKKKSLWSFCSKLKQNNQIDFIIDLHGTSRSFLTKLFLWDIPSLSVDKRRLERFLLVKTKLNLLKKTPSQHSRTILDFHKILNRKVNTDYSMHSNVQRNIKVVQNFFIIAPGASFETKRLDIKIFKQLALDILLKYPQLECKILAGPEDTFCDEFNDCGTLSKRVNNLQGKISLRDSLKEVEGASFVLCNDSLMSHLAQSSNIPALVIYGPTSEYFGFAPLSKNSKAFSVENLKCRPCSTTGIKKCSQPEQYCFTQLDFSLIKDQVALIMGQQ